MNVEVLNLKSKYEVEELKAFLNKFDLKFDETIDFSLVIRKNDEIVATASKSKNIIKGFAINDELRGEGVSNILVTTLLNKSFDQGIYHSFVFTKPINEDIFKGVGFKIISKTDRVALLEVGLNSIDKTINNMKQHLHWSEDSRNGLLVMNCNPFTLGHLYLIETAAKAMDNVLVLVVEEDKSSFPFVDRIELVKKGTAHINNVTVLPSSDYIISSATFPNYFLRKDDDALEEFMKLDTKITAEHFCKKLNISTRFVGEEPFCQVTKKYNDIMTKTFKEFNLSVVVIPRIEHNHLAISASSVRNLLKEDNWDKIKEIVPTTTFDFLQSEKGRVIIEKIKKSDSVH